MLKKHKKLVSLAYFSRQSTNTAIDNIIHPRIHTRTVNQKRLRIKTKKNKVAAHSQKCAATLKKSCANIRTSANFRPIAIRRLFAHAQNVIAKFVRKINHISACANFKTCAKLMR